MLEIVRTVVNITRQAAVSSRLKTAGRKRVSHNRAVLKREFYNKLKILSVVQALFSMSDEDRKLQLGRKFGILKKAETEKEFFQSIPTCFESLGLLSVVYFPSLS